MIVTASMVADFLSLATSMLIAGGYAAFLAVWISPRIRPAVPLVAWPIAALLSMALAGGLSFFVGPSISYGVVGAMAPLLVLSAIVDAKTMRIPNAYTVQAIFISGLSTVWLFTEGLDPALAAWSWLIALLTLVGLYGVNLLSRGGLGMGDVKLAPIMTAVLLVLAATSWGDTGVVPAPLLLGLLGILWLAVSFMLGGLFVAGRAAIGRKGAFPFGPFLVGGWAICAALAPHLPALFA